MKRVYVAGRTKRIEEIKVLYKWLESNEFTITYKWALEEEMISMPFRNSDNESMKNKMKKEIKAAAGADIFILLSDIGIRGAYIELGSFLKSYTDDNSKIVFIVGGEDIQHTFESLDAFRFVESVNGLKKELQKL